MGPEESGNLVHEGRPFLPEGYVRTLLKGYLASSGNVVAGSVGRRWALPHRYRPPVTSVGTRRVERRGVRLMSLIVPVMVNSFGPFIRP